MIEVFFQKKFSEEKKYVFDILLKEILGIEYKYSYHDAPNYTIVCESKKIEIDDCFFSKIEEEQSPYYKTKSLIPQSIDYWESEYSTEKNIPVLFGKSNCKVQEYSSYIQVDIIAGTFFMLTRWEEIICTGKDKYNRPDESNMLAVKHNFYKRPIVNEYAEFLYNIFIKTGFKINRKTRDFRVFVTHDIDFFLRFDTFLNFTKAVGVEIVKRKNLKSAFKTIKMYLRYLQKKQKDPFDNFDYFMDISERKNLKSAFYFIPVDKKRKDTSYKFSQEKVKKAIEKIYKRGHIVGIHPSLKTFDSEENFKTELNLINNTCVKPIEEGRQHFLMFDNPNTWRIWDNNMKTDLGLGFHSHVGFRCGICQEFNVFDVVARKKLKLKERPLILMDTALRRVSEKPSNFIDESKNIINITKKYCGDFVLLWHNSNLNYYPWDNWFKVYEDVVNYCFLDD